MKNGEQFSEPKNITMSMVLGWIVGILFILAGASMMTSSVLAGILAILAGLILLPAVNDIIKEKAGVNLSGVLRFVIAVILIGIAATMSADDMQEDVVGTTFEEQGSPVEESVATESVEKEWVKVAELTASSNKQSETFTLEGGQQKIEYTVTGGQFSMCGVYVVDEGESITEQGGFPVVLIDSAKTDETMMRKSAGHYYFDLQVANADCMVELYEYR
jgi:hypothetical protein